MALRYVGKVLVVLVLGGSAAGAQDLRRATVWDLKLGQPLAAQPSPDEYRGFACGSNGGPPRRRLSGWSEFALCPAEPDGLHEVYFEYDDELEYIARARDLDREVARWAGTTEIGFPVIASALFDAGGVLKGIRLVTDPRPEHRIETNDADLAARTEADLFGGRMAGRFDIDARRDCMALPPAEGETPVGDRFVKQACERTDAENHRKVILRVNYFRKPGQSAFNPQMPTQLTTGQFESSARLEVFESDSSKAQPGTPN
jgi:hypothetical protein